MLDLRTTRQRVMSFDDGEFVLGDRRYSYNIVPPLDDSKSVLYLTKHSAFSRVWEPCDFRPQFGMLAHYGLPRENELSWIDGFVGDRKFFFLGDCDPLDLLVFAVLRSKFDILYFGISDKLCQMLDFTLRPSLTIPLSNGEKEALQILFENNVDITALVGPELTQMLKNGHKLEIEALIGFSPLPKSRLFELVP